MVKTCFKQQADWFFNSVVRSRKDLNLTTVCSISNRLNKKFYYAF